MEKDPPPIPWPEVGHFCAPLWDLSLGPAVRGPWGDLLVSGTPTWISPSVSGRESGKTTQDSGACPQGPDSGGETEAHKC